MLRSLVRGPAAPGAVVGKLGRGQNWGKLLSDSRKMLWASEYLVSQGFAFVVETHALAAAVGSDTDDCGSKVPPAWT